MVHAVFTHADGSIYDDLPELHYHFPRIYLGAVEKAVGDWIVYYEPRRVQAGSEKTGGRQAYFATAMVERIDRDHIREDHFYARIREYIAFPNPVPFRKESRYFETMLQRSDGGTSKGAFGRSVRNVPKAEFDAILEAGFHGVREGLGADDWEMELQPQNGDDGFHDLRSPFVRPMVERLTRKLFRDAAFARQVKSAYGQRCAITGLRILNGGGRPEVQAAHIRPIADGGPDTVRNGLALSGTAHWMFDRGLISVDADHSILVAEDRLPAPAKALIVPDRKLILPQLAAQHPHPAYLEHHRARFKG
ncbi:HNH endonuclease [Roseovarius sp. S1116L3]|uniref:HNH endonuclease n=1 Tax=Roseovarius roseus TaxID=3342636 RepID=UPI003729793E